MQVVTGRDGALVQCLLPGVDDTTTEATWGRGIIATQVTSLPLLIQGPRWLSSRKCIHVYEHTKCVTPPPQCCEADGTCRRYVGTNDEEGCVAGFSDRDGDGRDIAKYTWSAALAKCESLGLTLCDKWCRGNGCLYDRHPVYTSIPC